MIRNNKPTNQAVLVNKTHDNCNNKNINHKFPPSHKKIKNKRTFDITLLIILSHYFKKPTLKGIKNLLLEKILSIEKLMSNNITLHLLVINDITSLDLSNIMEEITSIILAKTKINCSFYLDTISNKNSAYDTNNEFNIPVSIGPLYYGLWLSCKLFGGKNLNHAIILDENIDSLYLIQTDHIIDILFKKKALLLYAPTIEKESNFRLFKLLEYIGSNILPDFNCDVFFSKLNIFNGELLKQLLEDQWFKENLEIDTLNKILILSHFYKYTFHKVSSFFQCNYQTPYESEIIIDSFKILNATKSLFGYHNPSNNWVKSFLHLIGSLDVNMFRNLVIQCPSEIINLKFSQIKRYKYITAFELAALSCEIDCKDIKGDHKDIIYCQQKRKKLPTVIDCWYTSDEPDAMCSHLLRGEICPLSIQPELSSKGITTKPNLIYIDKDYIESNHNSIFKNLNQFFDPIHFSDQPSCPISVGYLENKEDFSQKGLNPQPQNLPIKMPFTDYRIPEELVQFKEVVQKTADYWHSINREYADYYYCYLSVAQSEVPPGCYQRRGHLHSDGFQSAWIKPKLFADFTFIVSDTASTEFYLKKFDVSKLNPEVNNYFKHFAKNMDVRPTLLRNPYEIIFMDAYTLHKAIKNNLDRNIKRTFVRIMYSTIRWYNKGNAHNPMFNYSWPSLKRDLLNKLI